MASVYQDDFKSGRNSQIDLNAEDYNGETPIMLAASLLHFEVVEILLSDPRVIIEGLEKHVGIKIKGRKDDKQRMVDMVKKEAVHRLVQPKTQEPPMVATDFIKEEHITKKSDEHNDQDGLTFTIDSRPEKPPQLATTPAEKGRRKARKKNALRSVIQAVKKEDSDLAMHLSDVSEEPGRNSQIDLNVKDYNGETPIMLAASLLHFEAMEILLSDPRVIIEGLEKYVGIKIKGRKDDKQRMVDMVKKEAAHRLVQPKTQEPPMFVTDFIKEEHITKKNDEHNDQDGLTFIIDSRPEKPPQPDTTSAEKGRCKARKKNALRSAIQAAKKEDSDFAMHLSDVSEEPGRISQIDLNAEGYSYVATSLHFEGVGILLSDSRVIIEGFEKHVGVNIKGRKDDKQRMVDMVKKEAAHRLAQPKTQEPPMVATDFIKEEHITKKSDEHNDQDGLTFTIDSRPEKAPELATTLAEKSQRKARKKNILRLAMHLSGVSEEPLDYAPAYSNEGSILTVRDSDVENFMGGDGPAVHAEAFEFSCWWHFMKAVEPNYKEKIFSYLHNYLTKNE